jgi:hypothetical protein
MAINITQLIELVIRPSLKQVNLYNEAAEQLIAGTAAKESALGFYLHQYPTGPAVSIYQIEENTYNSMCQDYLAYRPDLEKSILSACGYSSMPVCDRIITDLKLATIMCRIKYLWVSETLPKFGDIQGQANYWAKYYNGNPITGVPSKYIETYNQYVRGYYENT